MTLQTKKIVFWLKLAVFLGLLAYIVYVLRHQPYDWGAVWRQIQATKWAGPWLAGLLLLTPVNWTLEALKWQILIRRVEAVSLGEALKGVLAGLSLSFVLPSQVGDTTGRVLSLRTDRRGEGIGASLVSGGIQFYIAIWFGAVAYLYQLLYVPERNTLPGWLLLSMLAIVLLMGVLLAFTRQKLVDWSARWPWLGRYDEYWRIAGQYTTAELWLAMGVGTLRYLTFAVQFYMALRLYEIHLPPIPMASGIGMVYLVKTLTPAFNFLSDLGIREAASLWVFEPFAISAPILLTATFTLWLANVLLPVLVGLVWVWQLRWSLRGQS